MGDSSITGLLKVKEIKLDQICVKILGCWCYHFSPGPVFPAKLHVS